jgi:hypothetical protein
MIYLGVVLLIIGILVAVLVHNQIGVAVAVVGLLLILLGLLLPFSDADAAVLMVPFGPHMARLFRWAADRLDPKPEVMIALGDAVKVEGTNTWREAVYPTNDARYDSRYIYPWLTRSN